MRSVTSPQFGRLLHLRVVGQNNVLVGFPATVVAETDLELVDHLRRPAARRRASTAKRSRSSRTASRTTSIVIPLEPQFTYSNRSYWYPQSPVTDYATAKLTITVPGELDVVASGAPQGPATIAAGGARGARPRKRFVFEATQADALPRVS